MSWIGNILGLRPQPVPEPEVEQPPADSPPQKTADTSAGDGIRKVRDGQADVAGETWSGLIGDYKPVGLRLKSIFDDGSVSNIPRPILEALIERDLDLKKDLARTGETLDDRCRFEQGPWDDTEWNTLMLLSESYPTDRSIPNKSHLRTEPGQYHLYLHQIRDPKPKILESITANGLLANRARGAFGQAEGVYTLAAKDGKLPLVKGEVYCVFGTRHPCIVGAHINETTALFPLLSGKFIKPKRQMLLRLEKDGTYSVLSPSMETMGTLATDENGNPDLSRLARRRRL